MAAMAQKMKDQVYKNLKPNEAGHDDYPKLNMAVRFPVITCSDEVQAILPRYDSMMMLQMYNLADVMRTHQREGRDAVGASLNNVVITRGEEDEGVKATPTLWQEDMFRMHGKREVASPFC